MPKYGAFKALEVNLILEVANLVYHLVRLHESSPVWRTDIQNKRLNLMEYEVKRTKKNMLIVGLELGPFSMT